MNKEFQKIKALYGEGYINDKQFLLRVKGLIIEKMVTEYQCEFRNVCNDACTIECINKIKNYEKNYENRFSKQSRRKKA